MTGPSGSIQPNEPSMMVILPDLSAVAAVVISLSRSYTRSFFEFERGNVRVELSDGGASLSTYCFNSGKAK